MKPRKVRPAGWVAPGPAPRGAAGDPELEPEADEDLSFLTGDFRIFQKRRGHRWSLDDFTTAWIAVQHGRARTIQRALDLGCGIGSVLMMVAWAFPEAHCTGIEAQEVSARMARRSVRYNGIEERCEVVHGDLRFVAAALEPGTFDLVTGTPPYIPIGNGLVSDRVQRLPAFFETRGGLEDYCAVAAPLLCEGGVLVICGGVWPKDRGERAAQRVGLEVVRRVDVIPREGKPALFRVYVMARGGQRPPTTREQFVVRDARGENSATMLRARVEMGIPEMLATGPR